ncbi:MAG: hypothetical protein WCN98_18210 [Verrucomicrobiaceae bacterium]
MNPRINPISLLISVVVVFAVVSGTDFLIHQVWLSQEYKAIVNTWRPEAEMTSLMWAMHLSHLLVAIAVTLLYARIATTAGLVCAVVYGLCFGLFAVAGHLMSYFVYNVPGPLALKWVASGLIQGVLLGLAAFVVYKPAKE